MVKTRYAVVAVILIVVLCTSSVWAFDGKRKGFTLGGGIGFSSTSFEQTLAIGSSAVTSDRESKGGFGTDFRIGLGLDERWEIFYFNKVNWIAFDNVLGSKVTIASAVGGPGFRYYFGPEGHSWYLSGGMGLASWSAPFEDNAGGMTGFGVMLGGGYEFAPHWTVELDVCSGKPTDKEFGIEVSTKATAVGLKVIGTAY